MSRTDRARTFIEGWDPDEVELPDWVVDEIEADPGLQRLFDGRFVPWAAGDLGAATPRRERRFGTRAVSAATAAISVAAGLLCAVGLAPGLDPAEFDAPPLDIGLDLPRAGGSLPENPDRVARASSDGVRWAQEGQGDQKTPDGAERSARLADRGRRSGRLANSSLRRELPREKRKEDASGADLDGRGLSGVDGNGALMTGLPATHGRYWGEGEVGGNGDGVAVADGSEAKLSNSWRSAKRGVRPEEEVRSEGVGSAEEYVDHVRNGFVDAATDPRSTFSIDVDTASYALVRRKLTEGYLPPPAAVRVEEFVNAFPYDYPRPPEGAPFGVSFEGAPSPFGGDNWLVRVGVQGKRIATDQRRSVHLTFLVDTSGSMQSNDKLGLARRALEGLTRELRDGDTVALVAYAGSAGVILPPTPMSRRGEVVDALRRLSAGGSTAMGAGIALAYRLAERSYVEGAVNRVIVLSDGDANVGVTDPGALNALIRRHADKGIALTVAGFGAGNYKDARMERLANDGDGNYYYIDSEREAQRVFVDQLTSTMVVIGRDVKIQVDFDPASVRAYRLLGYENRDIADDDFRNDAVDAGEIGAGHRVTAIYELVLDPAVAPGTMRPLARVAVRNKAPGPDAPAVERSYPLFASALRPAIEQTSRAFRIALSAASFADRLRGGSEARAQGPSYAEIAALARAAARPEYPEDAELVSLIERARRLSGE